MQTALWAKALKRKSLLHRCKLGLRRRKTGFESLSIRRVSETPTPPGTGLQEKVLQYTSNFYSSTLPICIAGPSWLLSLEQRETQQYTSHLYCSTPPICTAARSPFVRQYLLRKYWGLGSPEVPESQGYQISEFFECAFGRLSSTLLTSFFPPSFPFKPCPLSYPFSPLRPPPLFDSRKTLI